MYLHEKYGNDWESSRNALQGAMPYYCTQNGTMYE